MSRQMLSGHKKRPVTVAVIGAGPVGLSAAANLLAAGQIPIVFEQGTDIAEHVRDWSHIRMFSTWDTLIDPVARQLLEATGWKAPQDDALPTGGELISDYLEPLSELPAVSKALQLNCRVIGVARAGLDKTRTARRESQRFTVAFRRDGEIERCLVDAVIDASGTWSQQNPLGSDGMSAHGEERSASRVRYGIPDVYGRDRADYAGKNVAIVGSGYSAANTVLNLVHLKQEVPETSILWLIRRPDLEHLVKDEADDVPARLALGTKLTAHKRAGAFELLTEFQVQELDGNDAELSVIGTHAGEQRRLDDLDCILCNTGQRPDLDLTRELRLRLDPALECVVDLAPLIDPNEHSCYSVPQHGWSELRHPMEPDFYIVGAKSYGRAATFLAFTGYHQVRSIVEVIAKGAADDKDVAVREGVEFVSLDGAI